MLCCCTCLYKEAIFRVIKTRVYLYIYIYIWLFYTLKSIPYPNLNMHPEGNNNTGTTCARARERLCTNREKYATLKTENLCLLRDEETALMYLVTLPVHCIHSLACFQAVIHSTQQHQHQHQNGVMQRIAGQAYYHVKYPYVHSEWLVLTWKMFLQY